MSVSNITSVEAIGTGLDGVVPFLVLGPPYHNVPGEETHFGPTLELGAIGQRDGHAEVSVLERLIQGQGQTIGRHSSDLLHLVLSLAVSAGRKKSFVDWKKRFIYN